MIIHIFNDASHSWGRVQFKKLVEFGIADKITQYSYMKGSYVYLEEDVDLTTLLRELIKREIQYTFKHHYAKRSSIRNFQSYNAAHFSQKEVSD